MTNLSMWYVAPKHRGLILYDKGSNDWVLYFPYSTIKEQQLIQIPNSLDIIVNSIKGKSHHGMGVNYDCF